ncbi:hypothetical protein C479_03855 [Halovivax asiaticus JCM 14624]|uniref:DUF5658 domain-containing protein n=1 Tax=Halovivax asiaticus JCM 14624 TaxID=1227490 RepID=M0BPF9_9EURY|nr:hypothetical protein [Halovivax asiaticus]ELZ12740.1 hypothetical protein C479_03855 [Halovivax asiaticus JCM 14624]
MNQDDGSVSEWIAWLRAHERTLWVIAILFYGVGDTITTGLGLWGTEAMEIGPIVAPLVDWHGPVGLLVVKVTTLSGFYVLWHVMSTPKRVAIPFALAFVGTVVTGWNVAIVSTGFGT